MTSFGSEWWVEMETRKPSRSRGTWTAARSQLSSLTILIWGHVCLSQVQKLLVPWSQGMTQFRGPALVCLETICGLVQETLAKGTEDLGGKGTTWPLFFFDFYLDFSPFFWLFQNFHTHLEGTQPHHLGYSSQQPMGRQTYHNCGPGAARLLTPPPSAHLGYGGACRLPMKGFGYETGRKRMESESPDEHSL